VKAATETPRGLDPTAARSPTAAAAQRAATAPPPTPRTPACGGGPVRNPLGGIGERGSIIGAQGGGADLNRPRRRGREAGQGARGLWTGGAWKPPAESSRRPKLVSGWYSVREEGGLGKGPGWRLGRGGYGVNANGGLP